jgi:hypothetical protein
VANREHEVRAHEDVDLAELDLLVGIQVRRRPEHHEQRVAVALQLRALVGDDGVLDRDLMQAELLRDRAELGLGRPEQADPGHAVLALAEQPGGIGDRGRGVPALATDVDRGIDDALLDRRGDILGPRLHRDLRRGMRAQRHRRRGTAGGQRETRASFAHGGASIGQVLTGSTAKTTPTARMWARASR